MTDVIYQTTNILDGLTQTFACDVDNESEVALREQFSSSATGKLTDILRCKIDAHPDLDNKLIAWYSDNGLIQKQIELDVCQLHELFIALTIYHANQTPNNQFNLRKFKEFV